MTKYLDRNRGLVGSAILAIAGLMSIGLEQTLAQETAPETAPVAAIVAKPKPLMKNFMGLNGHLHFKPDLYRPTTGLVRNYHPTYWDLETNTADKLLFPLARQEFDGVAVDWAKVYGSWKQAGYEIDVSLQFESIKPKDWKNLAQDARAYGEAFAKAFGPSSELNLVTSVEVGNEPADYSDETYRTMFENMAKGIRAGDSKMKILTSALLAGKPDQYCKSVNTVKGLEELYDVLNIHVYSMIEGWPTWRRVYPEHPTVFYLQALDEMVIWRDTQAPGKEIWVTEFGYDASTKKPEPKGTFAKWVGSTDTEQAQWLVRSFLIFSSKDIQRAYIYFYDDADKPSFHASSGLTRNFVPKPSYWAVAHLSKTLGDYHFSKIVKQEREEVYAYEYVNPLKPKEPIIVAWRPTDDKKEMTKSFPVTGTLIKAERMPLKEGEADSVSASITDGQVDLTLSETPTYLFLKLP